MCSLLMLLFFCFCLQITPQPLAFSESFPLACSYIFISSSEGIVQFIWREENTANAISLYSLPSTLPFISARSLICLCASSFSPCQSTRHTIYVPLPVSVSESGLHRSSQGRKMCWCISKQGDTGRTDVCPAARRSNLDAICFCNGPLNNNR